MENIYLEIMKIISMNHLYVDMKNLMEYKNNSKIFFNILFDTIDEEDIDTLIYHILYLKDINIEVHIMPNFEIILKKLYNKISFLNICIEKMGNTNFLLENEKIIKDNLDEESYTYFFTTLNSNDKNFAKIYKKEYKFLYELRDILNATKDYKTFYFEMDIMMPLIKNNIHQYLNYIIPLVFKNEKLNITPVGKVSGSSSFAFGINDLVLRLGSFRQTFDTYEHYRINEFIIKKRFITNEKNLYVDTCPKADLKIRVSKKDIEEAIFDLVMSKIVITDTHYEQNFAVVDYEVPKNMFRDVDGIIEKRGLTPSYTYRKKPVKLIDQDYMYDEKDPNKVWAKK
jgi:hypothetical protein